MTLIFGFSAFMYFTNYHAASSFFENLGFPLWLIYPLGIAKVLGLIAILSRQSTMLKEWAYAGFFMDASLALTAHLIAEDGAGLLAGLALISTLISRLFEHHR